MNKFWLTAGAAALAIAMPAAADPGGKGKGPGQQQQKGQGGGNGGHGGDHGKAMKGQGRDHGGGHKAVRADVRVAPMAAQRSDKQAEKAWKRVDKQVEKSAKQEWKAERRAVERVADRYDDDGLRFPLVGVSGRGLANGCPPGLAMKNNGCLPPGQAMKVGVPLGDAYRNASLVGPYRDWYRDDDRFMYRMGDGVIYQVNRSNGLIDALIPYGAPDYSYYPVGYNYPSIYNNYNVPVQYRSYYPDGGDYLYRYGGNAIYAVDPQTQMVNSIVSLLAGDLSVGQPLPSAYNVYNVPLSYRDQYADTANDWYRYNDGYIYRVDPTTQLVSAIVQALV